MLGAIERGNDKVERERMGADDRLSSGQRGQIVMRRAGEWFRWQGRQEAHTRGGIPRLVKEIRKKKPSESQYVYISQSYTGVSEQCPAPSPAPLNRKESTMSHFPPQSTTKLRSPDLPTHGLPHRAGRVRLQTAQTYQPILLPPFFCLRGVICLPAPPPPYGYLAFFSAGFRIWKEHSRVSSTLIIAPALSNSPQ